MNKQTCPSPPNMVKAYRRLVSVKRRGAGTAARFWAGFWILALLAPAAYGADLLALNLPGEGNEETLSLNFQYEIYAGGLHAASAQTTVRLSDETYTIATSAKTRGLTDTMFKGRMESEVNGRMTKSGPQMERYAHAFTSRTRDRTVTMERNETGEVEVAVEPPPQEEDEHKITEIMTYLTGVMDPLTAALFGATNQVGQTPCNMELPIFDGRRIIQLTFMEEAEEELVSYSSRAPFSGKVVRCLVTYKNLLDDEKDAHKERPPVTAWIAGFDSRDPVDSIDDLAATRHVRDALPARLNLPVRMEVAVGELHVVAHLVAADSDDQILIASQ